MTTPSGIATTSSSFTVNAPVLPSISSLSPGSGVAGSYVTITGAHLTAATSVKFNGVSASFVINSETQITAAVPASATSGTVTVTTASGTATSSTSFTVTH